MSNSCANGSNAFRVIRVVECARENNFNSATYGERENGDMGAAFADGRAGHDARKVLKDHTAVAHSWRDGEQ